MVVEVLRIQTPPYSMVIFVLNSQISRFMMVIVSSTFFENSHMMVMMVIIIQVP